MPDHERGAPDLIVLRDHPDHPGALPRDLDGTVIDLARLAPANMRPTTLRLGAADRRAAGLNARPTCRYEANERTLAVAEVWEVRPA